MSSTVIRKDVPLEDVSIKKNDERNLGTIKVDTVSEGTTDGGVTVDGVLIKDGSVKTTASVVAVPDANYSVLAANSGKVHVLPNFASARDITLPTPAVGLNYKFIYGGAAQDAHGIILDTLSDTNFYKGGVVHLDTNADDAADEVVEVYSDGSSESILNVTTIGTGTVIEVFCDGTNWYLNGTVVGATAPTFDNQ